MDFAPLLSVENVPESKRESAEKMYKLVDSEAAAEIESIVEKEFSERFSFFWSCKCCIVGPATKRVVDGELHRHCVACLGCPVSGIIWCRRLDL